MQDTSYQVEELLVLYGKHTAAEQGVRDIRALLERADTKRRTNAESQRRWNQVIDHLERSLDEARFRLEQCQKALTQAEKSHGPDVVTLARARAQTSEEEPSTLPHTALSEDPKKAVGEVMNMSLDELRGLTMEQVAALHAKLPSIDIPPDDTDGKQVASRLELAVQLEKPVKRQVKVSKHMERRNQLLLRRTMHKVRANRLADIGREEKELLRTYYDLLNRRIEPGPNDERLRFILETALTKLDMC